jgi:hypothetical protein
MEGFEKIKPKCFDICDSREEGRSLGFSIAYRLLLTVCLLFIIGLIARPAQAATLYPAPSSGLYSVGDTITIGVYVSSDDQAMNAVSGVLNIPRDKLEIVLISTGGSIINLWVREPSFSVSGGSVSFEGIVLNPGFTGSGGQIVVMTLRAIGPGIATINFSSGVVLANDGHGTNILRGMGTAQFTISGEDLPPPVEPDDEVPDSDDEDPSPPPERREPERRPGTPVVVSETHPDQNAWYAENDVKLNWGVPDGTTGVRLLVSRNLNDAPTVLYDTPIDSIELNDLDDGAWYAHVQLKGTTWSDATHFRFQIDTEGPEAFEITEVIREDLTEPAVRFDLSATDTTSGIDHYNVLINGQIVKEGLEGALKSLSTPVMGPGDYTIIVYAVDGAGNEREASAQFYVEPLNAPNILQYPLSLEYGDVFFLRGTTEYPNSYITLWVQGKGNEPISYELMSDGRGDISFLTKERLPRGEVDIWLMLHDERGASSNPSERISIVVHGILISDLWPWISYSLLFVIVALAYLLWRNWRALIILKRRSEDEDGRDEYLVLQEELHALREEIEMEKHVYEKILGKKKAVKKTANIKAKQKTLKVPSVEKVMSGNKRGTKKK